jgi:membrane fusion protein (multidrug efflux system)
LPTLVTGLPITATSPAFPDRTFSGTVSSIDSRVDPITRSITARAILPNPDNVLRPGLLMHIELLKNPRDVVVIPEEALIPSGRENTVLVVDRSTDPPVAQSRRVATGKRRPGEVEIKSGLNAGDWVITHGTLRARSGQPVTIIAVDAGDEPLQRLLSKNEKAPAQ